MRKLFDLILELIYPSRCIFCRRVLRDFEKDICKLCSHKIPAYMSEGPRRDIKHISLCVAPLKYRDSVRDSLHRYKFGSVTAYARIYADFIAKSIDENQISCDIISWVPLSKRRLRKRGYDQAELIARQLSEKTGTRCMPLLKKTRDTKPQSGMGGRKARRANAAGAYRCREELELLGKRVLLVDDIVTTGETLSECASVLRSAGCLEIYAACAATR